MRICSITLDQALGVWSELWQAYYGDNGFGGDTAEIYAFTLLEHAPMLAEAQRRPPGALPPDSIHAQEMHRAGREAWANLLLLLRAFQERTNCEIEVDGEPLKPSGEHRGLHHRCHVRISRRVKEPRE